MKLSLKIVWKTKITFLLSEKLPFFINKNIFYSWRIFFKIPKNLIASAFFLFIDFFLSRQILKNIDMRPQNPWMLHWENLPTESLKMIMWLIVPCFSVSDKHGQTSNAIWLSTTWHLIFWLEVAKKSLFTKSAIVHELKFPVKKI